MSLGLGDRDPEFKEFLISWVIQLFILRGVAVKVLVKYEPQILHLLIRVFQLNAF
jgi:hypothetical protein